VVLKADYNALETLASGLNTRGSQVEQASDASWRRAASRPLETGGPGGGWREVARAVEQAVLRILSSAFKDLGRALHTILQNTIQFLRKAITDLRHADSGLAANARRDAARDGELAVSKAGIPIPGQSGGSFRLPTDGSLRAADREERWAADAYEAIRISDDAADIASQLSRTPRVNGETGFTSDEISAIKNHVFFEEHPLDAYDEDPVISRYAPDADMAEAWLRLRSGRGAPQDVTLLEHEFAEHNYYVSHPGVGYSEAHAAANKVANWSIDKPPPTGEDYTKAWK
jgi:hypothetical protein